MENPNIDKTRALRLVRKLRERAYPPEADYLDGIAKASSDDSSLRAAGEAQIKAYCKACLQVKRDHPKPDQV